MDPGSMVGMDMFGPAMLAAVSSASTAAGQCGGGCGEE